MSKGRHESSKSHSRKKEFEWRNYKRQLDNLFFSDNDVIVRGSQEYKDFWLFFERFLCFQQKQASKDSEERGEKGYSSKLGLPKIYDKRYKINLSVLSKDTSDLVKDLRSGFDKDAQRDLTRDRLREFRSILLHYLDFQQKAKFAKLIKLRKDQENLPISQFKEQIIQTIHDNQAVIVAGDTGCGKSTQVPQYLLQAGFTGIACTQPRRIACISLANRVSYETLNEYGTEVGYHIRFEKHKTRATKILFLTEGLLLRQVSSDSMLAQYNVIVVDEVHERHLHGDFLLGVLKCILTARSDLKVILMSATINLNLFASYLPGAPVVKVPGRLFPIQVQYLPPVAEPSAGPSSRAERLDPTPYLKILQLIDHKYPETERGDLLVFMSGMSEISAVVDAAREYAQKTKRWIVLPLHSALSIEEQDKVFDVAPDGVRKCIVSTNIAETSITIDGVRFIADSGKVKEMSNDPKTKMQRLQEFWISQASAEQRKGRAGRTGPGVCFRLYQESDYDEFDQYATPEIHRVPLDLIILQMGALGVTDFLKFPFIEAPPPSSIQNSIYFLKKQGALTDEHCLTAVGEMLANLPVDVVIGKMLIMSSVFHMIDPILVIAAALSVQSPFVRRFDFDPNVTTLRRDLESDQGDPFMLLNAYDEWVRCKGKQGSSRKWCKRLGLEEQRFYEISKLRKQFESLLRDHGLFERDEKDEDRFDKSVESRESRHELRQLKRKYQNQPKKRKILKLDHDDDGVSSEEESVADVRDLEFKLSHNLKKLQKVSNMRRELTYRDINLLKIILCSGLYPQLAIPDECNSLKKDSDQLFHVRNKQYLLLHPSSAFAANPQLLQSSSSMDDTGISSKHELLAYVSLLETNKPYVVNVMRVPALQTLLLFGRNLDTNTDCTRIIVDGWLELSIPDSTSAEDIIAAAIKLRSTWSNLLQSRLQSGKTIDRPRSGRLDYVLANKLSEFLDARVSYGIKHLMTTNEQQLYKGPVSDSHIAPSMFSSASECRPHPTKGGVQVNEYLTYDCILDELLAEAASQAAPFIYKHWTCAVCKEKMICTVLERLQHEQECHGNETQEENGDDTEKTSSEDTTTLSTQITKSYFCEICKEKYLFTNVDILKHKRTHSSGKV